MAANAGAPNSSDALSQDVISMLDQLDEAELRATIDYARRRRQQIHPVISEQIEAGPGEEIVRIEEKPGYTLVVKREPCAEGCDNCPHGAILYHVREEPRPPGWQRPSLGLLGRVDE